MNESSASSPLLSWLREHLNSAQVFKHADTGMKGLPDSSTTWSGLTLWLEFKLHQPARHGAWSTVEEALRYFQGKAPTQAETCRRLAAAGHCYYVIWRKKVKEVWVCHPDGSACYQFRTTPEVGAWIEAYFRAGGKPPQTL